MPCSPSFCFLAVGVVLAELTRRHHRAALGHGCATASAAPSRPPGTAAARALPGRRCPVTPVAHAARRRAAGQVGRTRRACRAGPEDPAGGNERICPGCGWAIPADGTCPTCKASREAGQPDPGTGPTYSWGPADGPFGWPADDAETAHRWAQHMSTGGKPYVVTEYPPGGGPGRTVATYVNGNDINRRSQQHASITQPHQDRAPGAARRRPDRRQRPLRMGAGHRPDRRLRARRRRRAARVDEPAGHRAERLGRGPGRLLRPLPPT